MAADAVIREKETQETLADSHKKLADARRELNKAIDAGAKEEVSAALKQVQKLGADVQEKRKAHDLASQGLKAQMKGSRG